MMAGGVRAAVRRLALAGLVEGSVLAVAAGTPRWLQETIGARATVVAPGALGDLQRSFRTVLDLGGLDAHATPAARDRHVRLLDGVVEPAGFLHILAASDRDAQSRRRAGVPAADLLRAFAKGWTLLCVRDARLPSSVGGERHAWLASFVHWAARRRPAPSPVRHFTDLGAFGSLDLGAATDRPPWGT